MYSPYVAVILAGGEARRMQGLTTAGLKTLLPIGHSSILEKLQLWLQNQHPPPMCTALSIHSTQHQHLKNSKIPLLIDTDNQQRQGPMAGISAGLKWASQYDQGVMTNHSPPEWMLSLSGDSIELPDDLVLRMMQAIKINPNLQWVVAANEHRLQPPISLWRVAIYPKIIRAMAQGESKIDRLAQQFIHQKIVWSGCAFANVNFPNDLPT